MSREVHNSNVVNAAATTTTTRTFNAGRVYSSSVHSVRWPIFFFFISSLSVLHRVNCFSSRHTWYGDFVVFVLSPIDGVFWSVLFLSIVHSYVKWNGEFFNIFASVIGLDKFFCSLWFWKFFGERCGFVCIPTRCWNSLRCTYLSCAFNTKEFGVNAVNITWQCATCTFSVQFSVTAREIIFFLPWISVYLVLLRVFVFSFVVLCVVSSFSAFDLYTNSLVVWLQFFAFVFDDELLMYEFPSLIYSRSVSLIIAYVSQPWWW